MVYVDLYTFWYVFMRFWCVYELGVACKRAAGAFYLGEKAFQDFWTVSILEIVRIVRIWILEFFGICLKRRAPKSHDFWRYEDLQISHGEPIGEQNDELSFERLELYFDSIC